LLGSRWGVGRRGFTHAIALVAEVPGPDRRRLSELPDECTDEFDLPGNTGGVANRIEALEGRRDKQPATHPARDQPDDQRQTMLFSQSAKFSEPVKHEPRKPCLPDGVVRERLLSKSNFDRPAVLSTQLSDELKIRPQGEHTEPLDAVSGQLC